MTFNSLERELKFQSVVTGICIILVLIRNTNRSSVNLITSKIANLTLYFMINKAIEEIAYLTSNEGNKWTRDLIIETVQRCKYFIFTTAVTFFFAQNMSFQEFACFNLAYLVYKYVVMESSLFTVSYGVGMATSFFEGYLIHVLPNDGTGNGILEKIRAYEGGHTVENKDVKFPVKRLFVICTESMYCPPDLKEFNRGNRTDLARIEDAQSLEDVEKDVAGVRKRIYRNSIYKIVRDGHPKVYIAAECATPLHTLHRAMARASIYKDLRRADVSRIVSEFTTSVRHIVENNPETRGKCELVYFNDKDPNLNLADVLLDRIREIENDFENIF